MKNITAKYPTSGTAMRATSSGNGTTVSPLKANLSTIVTSGATGVSGEIRGRTAGSDPVSPFARANTTKPIAMGGLVGPTIIGAKMPRER